jgi:hypothetical protein
MGKYYASMESRSMGCPRGPFAPVFLCAAEFEHNAGRSGNGKEYDRMQLFTAFTKLVRTR